MLGESRMGLMPLGKPKSHIYLLLSSLKWRARIGIKGSDALILSTWNVICIQHLILLDPKRSDSTWRNNSDLEDIIWHTVAKATIVFI
jgi:hypothetical protein